MRPQELELKPTTGLASGLTIQFVEARWTGHRVEEVGEGVALSNAAFDLVEPCLSAACPAWTGMHRYGVFELPAEARRSLAMLLRAEAGRIPRREGGSGKEAELFVNLAEWLNARCDDRPISILGL